VLVKEASCSALTLIVPGEVKVDLANFDVKLPTNILCTGFKKYLFLQKNLPNLSDLPSGRQKGSFDVHFDEFMSTIWPWHQPAAPHSLDFTAISDHLSAAKVLIDQPGFESVSSLRPGRARGMAGHQLGLLSSSC
jgi:hypothetical protein